MRPPAGPFDVVAFDLDGTLVDTSADLAAALNHALAALDRPTLSTRQVRGLVGHGTRELLRKGLALTGGADEQAMAEGLPVLLAHYEAHICDATTAYPGVENALGRLAEGGVRLAICTNKPERLSRALVEALGWDGRFAAIIGGDTLDRSKPDPTPLHEAIARAGGGRAAYVGDAITDADTARAANLPFIAVTFGFRDRPVEQLGAHVVIDHYDELAGALRRVARTSTRSS